MEYMASDPKARFRQTADSVDGLNGLLARVDEIVPKLCTEMLYGCHISDDCRDDPIQAGPSPAISRLWPVHKKPCLPCRQISIHGSGFLEEFANANTIKCRIKNEPNAAVMVPATRVDDTTLTCGDTAGVFVKDYDPEATFAVEITIDGGTCAYTLRGVASLLPFTLVPLTHAPTTPPLPPSPETPSHPRLPLQALDPTASQLLRCRSVPPVPASPPVAAGTTPTAAPASPVSASSPVTPPTSASSPVTSPSAAAPYTALAAAAPESWAWRSPGASRVASAAGIV